MRLPRAPPLPNRFGPYLLANCLGRPSSNKDHPNKDRANVQARLRLRNAHRISPRLSSANSPAAPRPKRVLHRSRPSSRRLAPHRAVLNQLDPSLAVPNPWPVRRPLPLRSSVRWYRKDLPRKRVPRRKPAPLRNNAPRPRPVLFRKQDRNSPHLAPSNRLGRHQRRVPRPRLVPLRCRPHDPRQPLAQRPKLGRLQRQDPLPRRDPPRPRSPRSLKTKKSIERLNRPLADRMHSNGPGGLMTSKFLTVALLSVASALPQSIPVRAAIYTTTVDTRPVEMTQVVQRRRYHRRHRARRTAVRVGVGAAGGAAVGAAIAGGPGAAVGAVAGAGAGALYDHHERRKGN
jgi:hypothetical protein